jgi:ribosomal 30S subunit maturation factor RimM
MIAASEVVPIGQILKTHGIEGELSPRPAGCSLSDLKLRTLLGFAIC